MLKPRINAEYKKNEWTIAKNKQINDCWNGENKHQCWEQADQWLLKPSLNADHKQMEDC